MSHGHVLLIYWSGRSHYDQIKDDLFLVAYDSSEEGPQVQNTLSLAADIIPLSSQDNPIVFLADGCTIGDGLLGRVSRNFPYFSILSSSKLDEVALDGDQRLGSSPFAYYIAEALRGPSPDLDMDSFLSLEELHHYIYPRVVANTLSRQHPTVAGRFIHHMLLARAGKKPNEFIVAQQEHLETLSDREPLSINGKPIHSARLEHSTGKLLLSDEDINAVTPGLNILEVARRKYLYWREENQLQQFIEPYKKSRAILVAIDDYARKKDAKKRGPTKFKALTNMVAQAEALRKELISLGFQETDILTLYDTSAESINIEQALRKFWLGAEYANTDRLFFYYGGHGFVQDGRGLMATYDIEEGRPTLTTLGMGELIEHHSRNIVAHHVLFTLDTCFAGLAQPTTLSDAEALDTGKAFRRLSVIRADTEPKARNLLLAGSDDQRAVWENGGYLRKH